MELVLVPICVLMFYCYTTAMFFANLRELGIFFLVCTAGIINTEAAKETRNGKGKVHIYGKYKKVNLDQLDGCRILRAELLE